MNFKNLATQVLMQHIDGANNSSQAESALDRLTGGNKAFDLGALVNMFQQSGGDLASKAKSWLGDGANESVSATQLEQVVGEDKVAAFARTLGIDKAQAGDKLAKILPELIDKSSQGGELLDKIGGKSGLAALASKFLSKSA
ncbi:MAG: YidB family protein [Woeseiaceae bacterium]